MRNLKVLLALVVVAAFFGMLYWTGELSSLARVADVQPLAVVGVTAVTLGLILVSTWRLKLVTERVSAVGRLPFVGLYRVVLAGVTLGQVVPQDIASAGARIAYLKGSRGMTMRDSAFAVFLDRWTDLVMLLAAMPGAVLLVFGLVTPNQGIVLLIVVSLLFSIVGAVRPGIVNGLYMLTFGLLSAVMHRLRPRTAVSDPTPIAVSGWAFLLVLVSGAVRLAIVGLRAWVVVFALGIDLSLAQVLLIAPIAQVALMVPITPGGLGVYDAGWYGLLVVLGVSPSEALLFIVLHRVLNLLALLILVALTETPVQIGKLARSMR